MKIIRQEICIDSETGEIRSEAQREDGSWFLTQAPFKPGSASCRSHVGEDDGEG